MQHTMLLSAVNVYGMLCVPQELGREQPGPEFPGPPGSDRDRDRGGRGRPGLGMHDRDRDGGRDRGPPGSDPCHLYVGYIAAHVTDQMLEGLFRR
jgi:hypothetical protein